METIHVSKSDFNKIIGTAEVLINEVEHALSQDELVKKRIEDIKTNGIRGRTEDELDDYLKNRGVKIG